MDNCDKKKAVIFSYVTGLLIQLVSKAKNLIEMAKCQPLHIDNGIRTINNLRSDKILVSQLILIISKSTLIYPEIISQAEFGPTMI